MMKRLVSILFFAFLFLLAAALVVPGFIDWNKHKGIIIAQLEPYVQRKIEVAGNVSFKVLPNPQILLEDVSIENLLKLKTLEVKVKLGPLLEGKFEVENVNLVEPELTFEVKEDGSAAWKGVLAADGGKAPPKINVAAVSLNQVTLTQGKLNYINKSSGAEWHIEQLNLRIAADTLLGPYRMTGDMVYNGKTVNIDIGTGKYDEATPMPVRAAFMSVEGLPQVKLNGVVDLKSGFDVQGELGIEQGTLASIFGDTFSKNVYFLNDIADLRGILDLKANEIKLTDIKAKIGQQGGFTGKISALLAAGKKPLVTAELDGEDLKIFGKVGFLQGPENFDMRLALKGKRIAWNDLKISAVSLTAEGNAREWVIKSMTAEMAGQSVFKVSGLVTPKDKLASVKLSLTSEDISLCVIGAPFKKGKLDGSLDIRPEKISLYNFEASLAEGEKISGIINVDRKSEKFSADVNVTGGLAGLEGFSLKGNVADKTLTGEITAESIDFDKLNGGTVESLVVKAKKMIWRDNEISGADMKLEMKDGKTRISGLKGKMWDGDLAAEAEGASGAGTLKGTLTNADLDKFRLLLELDGFILGKGDIVFDLKDNGSREKMFHSMSGEFKIKTGELVVDKFDVSELPNLLAQLKTPPENLQELMLKSIKGGEGIFKNAEASFKIADGKFVFDTFKLSNADADVAVKGEYDLGPEKYSITADVKPKADIPAFTVTAPGYGFDVAPFNEYISKNNPVEVAPAPEPMAIPPAEASGTIVPEIPPAPETPVAAEPEEEDMVKGILDRLDETPPEESEQELPVEEDPPLQITPETEAPEEEILPPEEDIEAPLLP